jgi:hypothetical protein
VRKLNPAIYTKHKWLSGCAESSALLGPVIHHKIFPASALATSHQQKLENQNQLLLLYQPVVVIPPYFSKLANIL